MDGLILNATEMGFSHIKSNKACQDYSISENNEEYAILIVSDGHGGDMYFRSDRGSKFACAALKQAFEEVSHALKNLKNAEKASYDRFAKTLKLNTLYYWNELVGKDLKNNPFEENEMEFLDKDVKENVEWT